MDYTIVLTIINGAISCAGFWAYLSSRTKNRVDAVKVMQDIYKNMSQDTDYKIGQLTEEVHMLRMTVEAVYDNCDNNTCKNFILKKPKNK